MAASFPKLVLGNAFFAGTASEKSESAIFQSKVPLFSPASQVGNYVRARYFHLEQDTRLDRVGQAHDVTASVGPTPSVGRCRYRTPLGLLSAHVDARPCSSALKVSD